MNDNGLFHGDLVESSRIIYTPSDFAKISLLHIQEIGTLQATKPHISRRSNLNSFLFFMVRSGSGILNYEGMEYPLQARDCIFIDCTKPYYHNTSEELWNVSWVHFHGPTITNIYGKYVERGGQPAFRPKDFEAYTALYQSLYNIAKSDSYVRDMEINADLSKLLVLLLSDSWQPNYAKPATKKADLMAIKNYLDNNYHKKIALDQLAEHYYINKFYLTRIFKEQFGISISNYLLSVRITHAKSELRFTDKSIEEIGNACGLGAGYYFSRTFSKVEGMSPSEFRKVWRSR